MPDRFGARHLVLLGALLVFVAGLALQPMSESDLFFRLKVGQEILARHALMGRNLFSFTAPDHPDLDLAWAFEVGAALLYRAGGFPALVLAKTMVLMLVFAGAFALCRRGGAGAITTTLALAAAALIMRERFVERPHLVSFAGEVIVLAAIAALARPWSWRRVAAFAVAMVAWANAHAGVFAGALMLGLAGVAWLPVDRAPARRGLALAAVAAVAACATPVGPRGLVRYLTLHLTLPTLHPIDEFRAATWRSDAPVFVWLSLCALVVVVCALVAARRARAAGPAAEGVGAASWALAWQAAVGPDVLPGLGVAILGLATVRFAADAVLVTAPLLATRASALLEAGAAARARAAFERPATDAEADAAVAASRAPRFAPAGALSWALAFALVLATVGPRVAAARAGRRALDVGLDRSTLPLDALRFVDDNGLRARMYNDFEIGSYLVFEGYPRHRVFIDPRLPAYPEDMHRLLGSFDLDRATWDRAMQRYGVDSALLAYAGVNRRVAWWDPERWALVYRAGDARVFVRRLDRWRDLIAAREIPATFDFTVEEGTTTRPLEQRPARSPVADCEWQMRLGDLTFELDGARLGRAGPHYDRALEVAGCLAPASEARLTAWLGAVDLGARRYDRAEARLDRALVLSPDDTRTRANHAVALERAGLRAEARAEWTRVAREARGTALGDAAAARARRPTD